MTIPLPPNSVGQALPCRIGLKVYCHLRQTVVHWILEALHYFLSGKLPKTLIHPIHPPACKPCSGFCNLGQVCISLCRLLQSSLIFYKPWQAWASMGKLSQAPSSSGKIGKAQESSGKLRQALVIWGKLWQALARSGKIGQGQGR